MASQVRIPPALATIHNFIHVHDPEELASFAESESFKPGFASGELAAGQTRPAERRQANTRRDEVVVAMWVQYQAELQQREAM